MRASQPDERACNSPSEIPLEGVQGVYLARPSPSDELPHIHPAVAALAVGHPRLRPTEHVD